MQCSLTAACHAGNSSCVGGHLGNGASAGSETFKLWWNLVMVTSMDRAGHQHIYEAENLCLLLVVPSQLPDHIYPLQSVSCWEIDIIWFLCLGCRLTFNDCIARTSRNILIFIIQTLQTQNGWLYHGLWGGRRGLHWGKIIFSHPYVDCFPIQLDSSPLIKSFLIFFWILPISTHSSNRCLIPPFLGGGRLRRHRLPLQHRHPVHW